MIQSNIELFTVTNRRLLQSANSTRLDGYTKMCYISAVNSLLKCLSDLYVEVVRDFVKIVCLQFFFAFCLSDEPLSYLVCTSLYMYEQRFNFVSIESHHGVVETATFFVKTYRLAWANSRALVVSGYFDEQPESP